jgi:ABC-type taurine transport system ATPase subunit
MTRIRNVGGMIIKTTGGDYNMYSEGNIVQNAAGKITETGEEKGVSFGKPKNPPPLKLRQNVLFILDLKRVGLVKIMVLTGCDKMIPV